MKSLLHLVLPTLDGNKWQNQKQQYVDLVKGGAKLKKMRAVFQKKIMRADIHVGIKGV